MDNNCKIQDFSELAAMLDRYLAEDVKPEHDDMLNLINIFWELQKN